MIPNNKEHYEAAQKSANEEKERFLKDFPEERKKHEALSQCNEILTKAEIPYMMFPFLMTSKGRKQCWQYNNIVGFYEGEDELTQKDCEFSENFLASISLNFLHYVLRSRQLDREAFDRFINLLNRNYIDGN